MNSIRSAFLTNYFVRQNGKIKYLSIYSTDNEDD